MANNDQVLDEQASNGDSFLKTGGSESNNIYNDFFQETSDGNITIGAKAQKSGLEIATNIFGYIVPVGIFLVAIGSFHVFLRTQDKSNFAENYQFLCPYINYGVTAEDKGCKTIVSIKDDYEKKLKTLQGDIVKYLTEYIPIKVSQNIMDASPERKFILDTYNNKIHIDVIMDRFELEKKKAQYVGGNNIECNGITITNRTLLSTQCTIYGGDIGDDDTNRKLGSSRLETLRFLEKIGTTSTSNFVLLNPPTSLSTEKLQSVTPATNPLFKTRTTIQLQLQYVQDKTAL